MKFSKLNRLYINSSLSQNSKIKIINDQLHYLKNVLRLKVNNQFRVFNEINGEFLAQIDNITKNEILVDVIKILREPSITKNLILALSLIKPEKFLLAVNMAVQLGISELVPLITERCQLQATSIDRVQKYMIEATQQSERISLPIIRQATRLEDYITSNQASLILYANEHEEESNSIFKILFSIDNRTNIVFMVGPEGGFTDREIKKLASYNNTKSVSLGPNVLRSETAVASGLAQIGMILK